MDLTTEVAEMCGGPLRYRKLPAEPSVSVDWSRTDRWRRLRGAIGERRWLSEMEGGGHRLDRGVGSASGGGGE
jgi:hypothetical protein